MATLPNLDKTVTKDPDPPATDTTLTPIVAPIDGTTALTTLVMNKSIENINQIIDYISGDNTSGLITTKQVGNAKYTVYIDGADTKARNNDTGIIDSTNTDSTIVIQFAMDNLTGARTSKETVVILGAHTINATLTIPDFTCLVIQGKLTTVTALDTSLITGDDEAGGNTDIDIIGVGGMIDGNKAGQGAGATSISTVDFVNCTNLRIIDLTIVNGWTAAIRYESCTNVLISNCIIDNSGDDGVAVNKLTKNSTVTGCVITNAGAGGKSFGAPCGIEVQDGAENITVTGNVCNGSLIDGIQVSSHTGEISPKEITIIGNTCDNNTNAGINVSGVVGVQMSGVAITGNNCQNNTSNGIQVSRGEFCVINGNFSRRNQRGINLTTSAHDNHVTGNYCESNNLMGILVDGGSDRNFIISNNVVNNGFALSGSQNGIDINTPCDATLIKDNHVYDSRVGGARTQNVGITDTAENSIVTGNRVFNNISLQIQVIGSSPIIYGNPGNPESNDLVFLTETQTLFNKTMGDDLEFGGFNINAVTIITFAGTDIASAGQIRLGAGATIQAGTTNPSLISFPSSASSKIWAFNWGGTIPAVGEFIELEVVGTLGYQDMRIESITGGGESSYTFQFPDGGTLGSTVGGMFTGIAVASDTGTNAVQEFRVGRDDPINAVIATRPLFEWFNFTTSVWRINVDNSLEQTSASDGGASGGDIRLDANTVITFGTTTPTEIFVNSSGATKQMGFGWDGGALSLGDTVGGLFYGAAANVFWETVQITGGGEDVRFYGQPDGGTVGDTATIFMSEIAASDDVGSRASTEFVSRRSGATAIITRPLFEFFNHTTSIAQVTLAGDWDFQGNALTDGTLDLASITVTGSTAEFNTALQSETFAFIGVANAWGTINQNISATGKWQEGGSNISPIGLHDVWVHASGMWESTTGGCTALTKLELATDQDIQTLDFDGASITAAQFEVAFPKNWDAGTITATFYWSSTAADTDDVDWRLSGVSIADNELLTSAYGSAITVTDAHNGAANEKNISDTTTAITIAGAGKSEFLRFLVERDGASDTMTEPARLHGIMLHISIDEATSI